MKNVYKRTIIVTGANKGIGYGIIKALANISNNDKILLTSRNRELGERAKNDIIQGNQAMGNRLEYHQLDITDIPSRLEFLKYLSTKNYKIDVLVNTAATIIKKDDLNPVALDETLKTNFYSTVDLTEEILKQDLINSNGKIINISTHLGRFYNIKSQILKTEFLDKDLTCEKLYEFCKRYRIALEKKSYFEEGWPREVYPTYSFSKLCLNLYSRIISKRKDIVERNIQVYSCSPGGVKTDMGGPEAPKTIEQGVVTPLYLINLPDYINNDFQGKFFYECKPMLLE